MLRRAIVGQLGFAAALASVSEAAWAQQQWLISPQERAASAAASSNAPRVATANEVTDPVVEIILPRDSAKIVAPVDFDVRFRTNPPAVIDPSSIRVLYGFLRVDITRRIKEFGGDISAQGIKLAKAPLQPDSYTVTVEVANSQNRKATRTVRFNVE